LFGFPYIQPLEIRHLAGIVCKALDLALTPKNIKSGFLATGIWPYNPNVFGDSDFVQAVPQIAGTEFNDDDDLPLSTLRLRLRDEIDSSSGPSTSHSASMQRASGYLNICLPNYFLI